MDREKVQKKVGLLRRNQEDKRRHYNCEGGENWKSEVATRNLRGIGLLKRQKGTY